MRDAPRLFVTADLPGAIAFDAAQTNYLRNVLRLGPGGTVAVFNGRDGEWRATLERVGKRGAHASATERLRAQSPAPSLWYAFAPLKQARLDYMVEKAAEMGAGRLLPVLTRHTQVRRINRRRLQANVIAACEQCGILTVPEIAEPVALTAFLGGLERTLVVADETLAGSAADPVAAIRAVPGPHAVLIGPEGGFSDDERALLARRAVRVSLGPRVLRADTAAVALLALVEAAHPSTA